MNQQQADKIGHLKRENKALYRKIHAVQGIELPEPETEKEAQLVADMAQRIMRALES